MRFGFLGIGHNHGLAPFSVTLDCCRVWLLRFQNFTCATSFCFRVPHPQPPLWHLFVICLSTLVAMLHKLTEKTGIKFLRDIISP